MQEGVCPQLRELGLETVGMRDRDLLKLLQVCMWVYIFVLCGCGMDMTEPGPNNHTS